MMTRFSQFTNANRFCDLFKTKIYALFSLVMPEQFFILDILVV